MCSWAMRSMLIEMDNQLILIDTGIGNKQSDKFLAITFTWRRLTRKIHKKSRLLFNEVTDVFLTHLHFDHCGGGVKWLDKTRQF